MTKKQQNWNIVRGILADFFLLYQGTFYIANTQIGVIEVRTLQKLLPQNSAALHVEDYSTIFLRKEGKNHSFSRA